MSDNTTIKYLDDLLVSLNGRDIHKLNKDGVNGHLKMLDELADTYELKVYGSLISISEIQDMYKKDRSKLEKLNL